MKFLTTAALVASMTVSLATQAQDAQTLRLGMQGTDGDPQHQGVMAAAREIAEKSDGRLKLEVFANSQLGNFTEMLEQMTLGELDFTLNPFGGMEPWVPRAVVASTAYVVKDFNHLENIIASDWGQGIVDEMRDVHGWRTVDSWYFGTRQTTSKKAIESLDDFEGLRLRVPNSAPLLDWAKAMGASPTPVAFAEVYLALQTNQVDGQENPLPTIEAMKFMEVQDHLTLTGHLVQDQLILMAESTWQGLDKADRKIIVDAFKAGGDVNDEVVNSNERDLIAKFEANGATIHRPDTAAFAAAMTDVYSDVDKRFGASTVSNLTDLAQ